MYMNVPLSMCMHACVYGRVLGCRLSSVAAVAVPESEDHFGAVMDALFKLGVERQRQHKVSAAATGVSTSVSASARVGIVSPRVPHCRQLARDALYPTVRCGAVWFGVVWFCVVCVFVRRIYRILV